MIDVGRPVRQLARRVPFRPRLLDRLRGSHLMAEDPLVEPNSLSGGVALINPYELGRQPFALAHPAALLRRAGTGVICVDLSLQRLDPIALAEARLIAVYLGMHTATRIA